MSPICKDSIIGFCKFDVFILNPTSGGGATLEPGLEEADQYVWSDALTQKAEKSPAGNLVLKELDCTNNSGANTGLSPTKW